ncbi:MAG: nuclear transport factor 2 family protein [Halioglobus sp.]|nr:nuclear transport factor 2 family protein [Halioglobus sp.]
MDLSALLAERAIERNIYAFARAMDQRDWPNLQALLAPDATADFGAGEVAGRVEIVAYIGSFLDNCGATQHLIGNVVVDVDGDRATSLAYVSDMHLGTGAGSELFFTTLGEYRDDWVARDGSWLLQRRVKDNRATLGSMDVFAPS